MLALGEYASESDENQSLGSPPAAPGLTLPSLAAQVEGSDDDGEDEDEDGAGSSEVARVSTVPDRMVTLPARDEGLPSIEDVLAQATPSEFLAAPKEEFEHESFDTKAEAARLINSAASPGTAGASTTSSRAFDRTAEARAHAARIAKNQAQGNGKASGKGAEKKGESVKDRTKNKRKLDQSASFLGGRWKSEEEMHLRDHFDS